MAQCAGNREKLSSSFAATRLSSYSTMPIWDAAVTGGNGQQVSKHRANLRLRDRL